MLDRLPVELLYSIFSYLTPFNILYSFDNLTKYLNAAIINYDLYLSFNFPSISREEFYFLCHHVCPESVISLTVTGDDNSTMAKTKFNLLFSQLNIEYLTRLKWLTLINCSNYYANLVSQIVSQNVKTLQRLRLDRAVILRDVHTFPEHLRHLTFDNSTSISDLEYILQCLTPGSLTYLNVKLEGMCSIDRLLFMFERHSVSLTSLALKIEDKDLASFSMFRSLIILLVNLKQFRIEANTTRDLLDGVQWESIVSHLNKFDFRFGPFTGDNLTLLDSFWSPFWLEYKRWWVACDRGQTDESEWYFYTVPHFASQIYSCKKSNYIVSTAPTYDIFDKKITKLSIDTPWVQNVEHKRFTELKVLSFEAQGPRFFIRYPLLAKLVDLSQVEEIHVKFFDFDIAILLGVMPRVHYIKIDLSLDITICYALERFFAQIRSFDARNYSIPMSNHIIDLFCSTFAHVEHLKVSVVSFRVMYKLINGLERLMSAEFEIGEINPERTSFGQLFRMTRLTSNNTTVYCSSTCVYLWIGGRSAKDDDENVPNEETRACGLSTLFRKCIQD